jgi:hypothetical protein
VELLDLKQCSILVSIRELEVNRSATEIHLAVENDVVGDAT